MLESEFRLVFQRAVQEGKISFALPSHRHAYNVRQRLYRFRDRIRGRDSDSLNLLVDNLKFELDGANLIISYEKPLALLEMVDEPESK